MTDQPKRSARLFERDGKEWLRITLAGKATDYVLEDLRPDPKVANPAWRLSKPVGPLGDEPDAAQGFVQYDVHTDLHGHHCTCGDFEFRKARVGEPCKHIAALRAVGKLR